MAIGGWPSRCWTPTVVAVSPNSVYGHLPPPSGVVINEAMAEDTRPAGSPEESTLLHFLCHVQDRPMPEPKVDLSPSAKPWYESFIDEDEGLYDVKRTRVFWEEIHRRVTAARQVPPDSGREFLAQLTASLSGADDPEPGYPEYPAFMRMLSQPEIEKYQAELKAKDLAEVRVQFGDAHHSSEK
jgi:hypothetical protein